MRDGSGQGQRWPWSCRRCTQIWRCVDFTSCGRDWVFLLQRCCYQAIGGLGHLALIVLRVGASAELAYAQCSVKDFEPGSVISVLNMVVAFFCAAWFSLFTAAEVHKKNRTIQPHFLMLPPCDCIAKIVNNFTKGTTFENQTSSFEGDWWFDFFGDGEKKDEWCWSKVGDREVGVKHKNVPYTYINFFPYSSTYLCTPYW